MNRKAKKSLSILLSLVLIFIALPMTFVSSAEEHSGDWVYEITSENTAEITRYNGNEADLTIPSELDGYAVTSIGNNALSCCYDIVRLIVPDNVTHIAENAVSCCYGLKSVEITGNIINIDKNVFSCCYALESVLIRNNTVNIAEEGFCNCYALERITFYGRDITIAKNGISGADNLTICAFPDTYAKTYAEENHFNFLALKDFPDVSVNSWFFDAVQYNALRGFITGYKDGKFGPADALQRQDFVVILARIAGADIDGYTNCKLTDVDMKAYYGKAVAWAVDKGIISGYQNGKFGVGDKITREQVATILYRYMGSPDVDTSVLNKFPDKGSISAFAVNAFAWANTNDIINGKADGKLAPVATASRAEIAVIIMRMDQQGMFA